MSVAYASIDDDPERWQSDPESIHQREQGKIESRILDLERRVRALEIRLAAIRRDES